MCCHLHPDNGRLALEKVDSSAVSPWTLEELQTLAAKWHSGLELDPVRFEMGDYEVFVVRVFLTWLGEQ